MSEAFDEIVSQHMGKRIAMFSHGCAITFFLMRWCSLKSVNQSKILELEFNGKTVMNKKINSPEVFKITLNQKNEVIDIDNIEFEDLDYMDFK